MGIKFIINTVQCLAIGLTLSMGSVFAAPTSPVVRLGNEQLFTERYLPLVLNKRVGILAHYASRTSQGVHVVDALAARKDVQLKMIFSPEHGFRGVEDAPVRDSKDSVTGLPVYSLYGPRRAPTAAMFAQLDVILIDIQDVGLRYYTYPATIAYILEAASDANIPVVILDRPNPINGAVVNGATLEKSLANRGLTTIAEIPTRHGMTLGEISAYLNAKFELGADLTVVPMLGWKRSMNWSDTGLNWIPSSPALMKPDQVDLYALFGTLESLSIAVGRGKVNDLAFRNYGAPWITAEKAKQLVIRLKSVLPESTSGLKFSYVEWTPDRSVYDGVFSRGFKVEFLGSSAHVDSLQALLEVLKAMHQVLGSKMNLNATLSMVGARWVIDGVEAQASTSDLMSRAHETNRSFLKERQAYLLY